MKRIGSLTVVVLILMGASQLHAHCQIPCGIYDDSLRFELMAEHITTIEKSMNQITELSAAADPNYNQLVRWIDNKEVHADQLMEIVTQYFMSQRIKPVDPSETELYAEYQTKVTLLHQMLVAAMKCKQTTELRHTVELRRLLNDFEALYF